MTMSVCSVQIISHPVNQIKFQNVTHYFSAAIVDSNMAAYAQHLDE